MKFFCGWQKAFDDLASVLNIQCLFYKICFQTSIYANFSRGSNTITLWGQLRFIQKQPRRGFPRKRCSEDMQQIYRRIPMLKCDFKKVAKQLYWNRTSAWMFCCKFAAYFQNIFIKKTFGWLLLICCTFEKTKNCKNLKTSFTFQ